MKWLKTSWTAITVAIAAAVAIFAVASAKRHKQTAEKWQDKAVDIELGNVVKGVETAKQASTKAKLHEAKAKEVKKKAEARITQIGEKDEEISSILDAWRAG